MPAGMARKSSEEPAEKDNLETVAEQLGARLAELERKNASYQAGFERLSKLLDKPAAAGSKAAPDGESTIEGDDMQLTAEERKLIEARRIELDEARKLVAAREKRDQLADSFLVKPTGTATPEETAAAKSAIADALKALNY